MTAPNFTNLQHDKHVIVWNHDCLSNASGTIGGTVTGNGVLHVTSIDAIKTTSSADGTFAGGWKYVFHITAPSNEPNVAMKFTDWTSSGSSSIAVANNIRISSAQANSTSTVTITAANTYSSPALVIGTDLDPGTQESSST